MAERRYDTLRSATLPFEPMPVVVTAGDTLTVPADIEWVADYVADGTLSLYVGDKTNRNPLPTFDLFPRATRLFRRFKAAKAAFREPDQDDDWRSW